MKKDDSEKARTLDEYGIIFLSGEIDQSAAEQVCQQIIEFNIKQEAEFIQLIINSPGGACAAGFAIVDMMDWSGMPVYTTGVGIIGSIWIRVLILL